MADRLPYKVECRRPESAFAHLIAAFDCQPAAEGYAGVCALRNMTFTYRVKRGRRILREFKPNEA